jgi:hypothetical protein
VLALAGVWVGLACGSEPSAAPEPALLDGIDPVVVGTVADTPALPWEVASTPSFRAGGASSAAEHQFAEASAATLRSDGSVVIADARTGLVRLYDHQGRYVSQVGLPGQGPGEFQGPTDVWITPGDTLLVWDAVLWRTSAFGPDGTFLWAERYDPTAPGIYPLDGMWPTGLRLGPAGTRLVSLLDKGGPGKGAAQKGAASVGLEAFALHDLNESDVRALASLPGEERAEVMAPWGPATLSPPLAAGPRAALSPRGSLACIGHQSAPEVLCILESGARTGVRWTDLEREVRSDDPDVVRWREATITGLSQKMSVEMAEEVVALLALPERRPAFRDLYLDPHGYLWVDLGPDPESDGQAYLVLDQDLSPVGTLRLPGMDVLEVGDDHILGVRYDLFGIPEVLVFPLRRRGGHPGQT